MISLTPNVRRFLGLEEFDAQQSAPPDEISAPVTPVDSSQWDAASVPTAGAGGQSWAPPAAEPQYDPRDADQGPRETGPAPWTPLSPNTPEPTYQIADGRTAPPTPNGTWEPVRTIPKPQPVAEEPPNPYGAPRSIAADLNPGAPADYGDGGAMRNEAQRRGLADYKPVRAFAGEPDYVAPARRPITAQDVPDTARAMAQAGVRAAENEWDTLTKPDKPGIISQVTGINPTAVNIVSRLVGAGVMGPGTQEVSNVVMAVINQFGDTVGRRVAQALGMPHAEYELMRERVVAGVQVPSITVSNEDVAGLIGSMLLDPTNLVGAGAAKPVARAAGGAAREIAAVAPEIAQEAAQGAKRAGYALAEEGARQLMDLTPSPRVVPRMEARNLPGGVRLPEPNAGFERAVENTPGAFLGPDGLEVDVIRYQKPEQAGQPVVRGAPNYGPAHWGQRYRREGDAAFVGGTQRIEGSTIIRRPLVVQGDEQWVAPSAFDALEGAAGSGIKTFRQMSQALRQTLNGVTTDDRLVGGIIRVMDRFGITEGDPEAIVRAARASNPNNPLAAVESSLFETLTTQKARQAGYDGIVGYRPGETLGEIIDLREAAYPTPDGGYTLRADATGTQSPTQSARNIWREGRETAARLNAEPGGAQVTGRIADGMALSDADARQLAAQLTREAEARGFTISVNPADLIGQSADDAAKTVARDLDMQGVANYQEALDFVDEIMRGSGAPRTPDAPLRAPEMPQPASGRTAEQAARATLPFRGQAGSVTGAVAGGVTGAASGDEDTTWQDRVQRGLIGAAGGLTLGAGAATHGTIGAARLIDSLIERGALPRSLLSSHPDTAERIRAMFALAAQGKADDATVSVPGLAQFLARIQPSVRTELGALLDDALTAGQVREIVGQQTTVERIGKAAAEVVTDVVTGLRNRGQRARETAADAASVRGLPNRPPRPVQATAGDTPTVITTPEFGSARRIDDPNVTDLVHSIADEMGVPRPAVYVTDRPLTTAATVRTADAEQQSLLLGRGLFGADLTEAEVRGLIAHELTHTTEDALGRSLLGRVADAARGVAGRVVPEGQQPRLTVEVIRERMDKVRALRDEARAAGDAALERDANDVLGQLQTDLYDAQVARRNLEPRITSDVGRRLEDLPITENRGEQVASAMGAREAVRAPASEFSAPVQVQPSTINRANAIMPFDPASAAAGGAAGLTGEGENGEQEFDPLRAGAGMAVAGLLGNRTLSRAGARWRQATQKAAQQAAAARAAGKAPPATAGDWLRSIGYSGMIGPSTGVVNALGNGMELLYHLPKDLLRAAVRGNMREAGAEAQGLVTGFVRAGGEILDALAGAHPGGGVETARLSQRVQNPIGQVIASLIEAPTRVFSEVPDAFYRSIAQSMGESRAAAQLATQEGLTGSAWSQRVSQLLAEVEAHKAGGLTLFPQQVDQIVKDAETLAERLTLRGEVGPRGKAFKAGIDALPFGMGNLIMPFFNTPYQMLQRGAERSVAGLAMGTQPTKFDKYYDVAVGTGIAAGAAGLAMSGAITGSGPSDPQQRRQLQSQGWQARSTLIGGVWVPNNTFGVFGPLLDTAGEMGDAVRYQKKDMTGRDIGGDLVKRAAGVVSNQVYLKGISDILKAMQDPATFGENYAASTISRMIPGGATARMAGNMTDPNERTTERGKDVGTVEAIRQSVARSLPGQGLPLVGGREGLPVAQDVLGRPQANERQGMAAFGPRLKTPKPDPIIQAFDKIGAEIGDPPEKVAGVDLTPAQKRRYQQVMGRELQRLAGPTINGAGWATMPPNVQKQLLESYKSVARTLAETAVQTEGGREFTQNMVKATMDKAAGK